MVKTALVAVVLILAQVQLNSRLIHLLPPLQLAKGESASDILHPDPGVFRILSVGHRLALVDWFWVRSLVEHPGSPRVARDLNLAVHLDPVFYDAYLSGAHLLAVVGNNGEGARSLLLQGERFVESSLPSYPASLRDGYWKQGWSLYVVRAYVDLFERHDLPSAAEAFAKAGRFPNAPVHIQRLAERLREPGGVYEVGSRLLQFMSTGSRTEEERAGLERKLRSLEVAHYLFELNQKPGRIPALDPWGGTLSRDPSGKVVTTTPHEPVFGLN